MNPTPYRNESSALRRQRRQLARWLAEWRVDQCIRKAIAPMGSLDRPPVAGSGRTRTVAPDAGRSKAVRVGQIRLLRPAPDMGPDDRPVYVVVLKEHTNNSFLIAPFGRFSTPADPGEWQTGLKAPPLRVLCMWNSRVVSGRTLAANSWPAGHLASHKVAAAMEVYRHRKTGAPLTTVRTSRIGPPLLHPLDPRLRYRSEEAALLEECLPATEAWRSAGGAGLVYEMPARSGLLLAAEDRPGYGRPAGGKRRRSGSREKTDDRSDR